jgi:2-octaprenyl-6-methoxyphenol hydroxylase
MTTDTAPADPYINDIVIAGGGQVGLALAVALRLSAPTLSVMLVDATSPVARSREGRASTIVAGGRRMLEQIGVWDAIAPDAEAVTAMIVTDSRTQDVVRPVFLTFAHDAEPVAHVVPDGVVVAALHRRAQETGVRIVAPESVDGFVVGASRISVRMKNSGSVEARLLVAADGARSRLRQFAGIATVGHAYGQSGIVVTVTHERPHGGRAEEHFLPSGPFAILPLTDTTAGVHRSSLVWTEPTELAERLVAADRLVLQSELERRFGHHLGVIAIADVPRAFALSVAIARSFVKPRLALIGDAAHSIHPIAGQGLNLGYRDVAALAETIVEAHRLGLDVGSETVLERYQRWRRYDTTEMALVTDGLNALFASDNPVLRLVRDVGLGLVERAPDLKRYFINEASGATEAAPRLLRGEAI